MTKEKKRAYDRKRNQEFKLRCLNWWAVRNCKLIECLFCGYNDNFNILQFHHQAPYSKKFGISSSMWRDWGLVKKEINKTIVLCPTCHFALHQSWQDDKYNYNPLDKG